jgi:hypothetical protein
MSAELIHGIGQHADTAEHTLEPNADRGLIDRPRAILNARTAGMILKKGVDPWCEYYPSFPPSGYSSHFTTHDIEL